MGNFAGLLKICEPEGWLGLVGDNLAASAAVVEEEVHASVVVAAVAFPCCLEEDRRSQVPAGRLVGNPGLELACRLVGSLVAEGVAYPAVIDYAAEEDVDLGLDLDLDLDLGEDLREMDRYPTMTREPWWVHQNQDHSFLQLS